MKNKIYNIVALFLFSTCMVWYGYSLNINKGLIKSNADMLKEIHESMNMRTEMLQKIIDKLEEKP